MDVRVALPFLAALLATGAEASSRFELIGRSATHLAVRELYSRSACCGADEVFDCRYEGVAQLEKRLDPIKPGIKGVLMPRRLGAVRLHILPWKAGELVDPTAEKLEGRKTFEIYESVTRKDACTPKAVSVTRLADAHAYAASVGIDLKVPIELDTLTTDPTVSADECTPAKYAPACHPEEPSTASAFVFGEVPDTRILHLYVQVAPGAWRQVSLSNNGGVWLAPRREFNEERMRIVHFRRFTHFMGEVFEFPLFLVEPR